MPISNELREKALSVTAAELKIEPVEARRNVWGVLMELGYPQAVATLAVFAEGSTSLYISTGGGVIGAGEHPAVREEAEKLLDAGQAHLGEFERADETPLPEPGRVRFYLRTFGGTLTAEADEKLLESHVHRLTPLFRAGHAVITQIRLISQSREEA